MIHAISRIIARYISGALVAYGILNHSEAEYLAVHPDVILLIGAAIGAATEAVYVMAKKRGWVT